METKKSYSEQLKDPRWQKRRLEILSRDEFACKKCGDTDSQLHVHHKRYINGHEPWQYDDFDLITLCVLCHKEIEEIIKSLPHLNINNVKIFKSKNWKSGNKVMFIKYPNNFEISVYDKNNNQICGFNFHNEEDIPNIHRILNNL